MECFARVDKQRGKDMKGHIYERFAYVYDACVRGAPYDKWVRAITGLWSAHGCAPISVLELGCGTGSVLRRLAALGYDMIGVDASADMLACARDKAPGVLLLQQDMRELELYGTVDAAISVFECMNYLPNLSGLLRVFANVRTYLNPGGLFIFDINSKNKYIRLSDETPYCRVLPDLAFIWEYDYDHDTMINECTATFFTRDDKTGQYERFTEIHCQRAYARGDIEKRAAAAGLELIEVLDADTMAKPDPHSERWYFVYKKPA